MSASIDVFKAAVDALHATGDPSASQYLVAFADDPSAPQLCEVLITDASASPAQQTFAAGIIARAAANLPPNQTVDPLLKLIGSPTTCSQAVASQCMSHYKLRLMGPPNRPTQDHSEH